MDILHNLWNIVSTEDENLVNIIGVFLTLIESYVTLKLFTTFLDIKYTKKQRNLYIIIMEVLCIFSGFIIPKQYSLFLNLLLIFIIIKLVFKTSLLKALLGEILPMLLIVLLETIYVKICFNLFGISIVDCSNILIYRVPYVLTNYLTIFLVAKYIKFIKLNLTSLDGLSKNQKKLLITNLIFTCICFGFQFYLLIFYSSVLPSFAIILSLVFLITYSIVSIYSVTKTINLETAKVNLEQSELHNKTLELLYNNMRAFKHDFFNILTAFGGYIYAKDMDGITKYYDKVLDECNINNNLSTLNPEIINNAAVYNILASKYYKADELGIKIDLKVFIDLNQLKMDIYDFSRILGILLDNSIEAASQCEEKIIKIEIRDFKQRKCQILTIENTYLDKNININQLFEKGYTSKTEDKENHGIGLWQVSKMIKKHNNVLLDTSKNNNFFKQELAIYYQ